MENIQLTLNSAVFIMFNYGFYIFSPHLMTLIREMLKDLFFKEQYITCEKGRLLQCKM